MKRKLLIFSLFLLSFIILIYFFRTQKLVPTPVDINIVSSPSHLKYFGYLSNDYLTQSPTYFSELDNLGNTNIAWGVNNLSEFAKHGISILYPTDAFFGRNSSGQKYLVSDWQNRWQNEQTKINPYLNNIYAIYFDEPVWGGVSRVDFLTATNAIRETYPNMHIMVVEAGPPFLGTIPFAQFAQIPTDYYRDVTDIGFDYYFVGESANNDQGWNQYMNIFNNFISYAAGKHVWLVPDGYGDNVSRWPDAWERYIQFAQDHDIVIGILGFIYDLPSELMGPGVVSLRNVMLPGDPAERPSFRWRQREVGQGIIANAPKPIPSPTPTPLPGDFTADGHVDIYDYNEFVAGFGTKYTIYDYNTLVANYGK